MSLTRFTVFRSLIGLFLVLVVRLHHLLHEGGGGGGELLTGGGAVGGGQVEERVHLVGRRWGYPLSRDASQMMQNKLGATWLLPPLWDSCSSTRSGRGGRRRGRTLPGWTLTRWTLSWKIKDVETYHVSSSVQSREATSSTVSRPGIWLAGEIRTWSWQGRGQGDQEDLWDLVICVAWWPSHHSRGVVGLVQNTRQSSTDEPHERGVPGGHLLLYVEADILSAQPLEGQWKPQMKISITYFMYLL